MTAQTGSPVGQNPAYSWPVSLSYYPLLLVADVHDRREEALLLSRS